MTIRVGNLPKVAFFFTGITFEIKAKKLSKNMSIFTLCLLPSTLCLLLSPFGYYPSTPMLGLRGEIFHWLRMLPDIMSGKCDPNQIRLLGWAGESTIHCLPDLNMVYSHPPLQTSNISELIARTWDEISFLQVSRPPSRAPELLKNPDFPARSPPR